jgi:hypothetical protein
MVPSDALVEKKGLKRPSRLSVIITNALFPPPHPERTDAILISITMHRISDIILFIVCLLSLDYFIPRWR